MRRRTRRIRPTYRRYAAVAASPLPLGRSVRPAGSRRSLRQARTLEFNRQLLTSLSLLVVLAVAGIWIGFDDAFYVHSISVSGNARVPVEEIAAGSGLAGMHVLWVNSHEIEAAMLRAVPSLRGASVSCVLPADCTIRVIEREPFVAWRWGQAKVWLDRGGAVFTAQGDAPGVITIDATDGPALVPGQTLDASLLAALAAISEAMPEMRAYRYSVARGLEFTDPNGFQVYLGAGSNMGDRVAVWRALREDLAARGIAPAYINVQYPLAPYYGR